MVGHSLDFGSDGGHFLQKRFELVDELLLGRVEADAFLSGVIELNDGLNVILFGFVVHFVDDLVGRLLVDKDLGLNNHVVNQTDECAEVGLVSGGQEVDSLLELHLFLKEHH